MAMSTDENSDEVCDEEDLIRVKMGLRPRGNVDIGSLRRKLQERNEFVDLQRKLAADEEEARQTYLSVHSLPTADDYRREILSGANSTTEDEIRRRMKLPWPFEER
jgi:hypothetical protein